MPITQSDRTSGNVIATLAQRVLLGHIACGEVARVHHARGGWAIRITTVRSRGAGGGLGRKVDAAVRVLAELGWAYEGAHDRRTGYIWHLTDAGHSHLQGAEPTDRATEK